MAHLMTRGHLLHTSCGSPHYASPEIMQGLKYDAKATDVWSMGVILFAMLTGSLPFDHDNIPRLIGLVIKGRYTIPRYLAADEADLIQRMLMVNPVQRITLPQIRAHSCFVSTSHFQIATNPVLDRSVLEPLDRAGHSGGAGHLSNHLSCGDTTAHVWCINHGPLSRCPYHSPAQQPTSMSCVPTSSISLNLSLGGLSSWQQELQVEVLDDALLVDLESMGLSRAGGRAELESRVRGTASSDVCLNVPPSQVQLVYKLMSDRKYARLNELSHISPSVEVLRRTQLSESMPAHVSADGFIDTRAIDRIDGQSMF
jgi:serine/threonine protein kinase